MRHRADAELGHKALVAEYLVLAENLLDDPCGLPIAGTLRGMFSAHGFFLLATEDATREERPSTTHRERTEPRAHFT